MTFLWKNVSSNLDAAVADLQQPLDDGQRASLSWIGQRIGRHGVVLADEVGTGKTRIACALVHAVIQAGGRAAVVVPHGLIHQWKTEMGKLAPDRAQPKELTTLADFEKRARDDWESFDGLAPAPNQPEWLLISHGFRTPQVRMGNKPAEWRVALPSYVRAELSAASQRNDARTRFGKLLMGNHNLIVKSIAEGISKRVRGGDRQKLRNRLDALPVYRRGGNNNLLIEKLQQENGRRLMENLLGLWLGEFDLLVVDEAHKSRGEADVEGTALGAARGPVLARLVDVILKQPEWGRRLCMTATPMELDLSQWLDLLKRARSGIDDDDGTQVIEDLRDAAKRAVVAPDEGLRLDELCAAARGFRSSLAPFVTRRRRDEDPLIVQFRKGAKVSPGLPHPHRRLERLKIGWSETRGVSSAWLDVLFAAECMSQSARGLSRVHTEGWPKSVKYAYTQLSAGHVCIDLEDEIPIPEPSSDDERACGKISRTKYWRRNLRNARGKVVAESESQFGGNYDPACEHPRITAAVQEIERWTSMKEKVLVFGVFLRPLRLLRDVLNVRHALRAADAGRPMAHALHTDPELFAIAIRQSARLREEKTLSGRLLQEKESDLSDVLRDSHKKYERLRRSVRDGVKRIVKSWRNDSKRLGAVGRDLELEESIQDHLISLVIDDYLTTLTNAEQPTNDRIDELADDYWKKSLCPLLGEHIEDAAEQEGSAQICRSAIRSALIEDHDGRQSLHARLLQGETRWETRRYLQSAFNRLGASPRVLIAQSQVGREGLNLHEACRVVVQFHAEWNPAVLEQQVGRVDRKGSLWEKMAKAWLDNGASGETPYIEVRQLVFEGTYDAYQWDRVMRRQQVFDASLFGSLLPAEAWQRVPSDRKQALLEAAPSFTPPSISGLQRRANENLRSLPESEELAKE